MRARLLGLGFWDDEDVGGVITVSAPGAEKLKWREGSCCKSSTPYGKVSERSILEDADVVFSLLRQVVSVSIHVSSF